ncbi:hypothetical protein [uncultured Vagococcus sp.]|uniref:hypothetical protein n=1 Tax=uncultured Vagococcus sp. TaxID=189676 RepID=UPI0028D0062E|nr:hypothetical protein [uncultured Vagococcus sp.]
MKIYVDITRHIRLWDLNYYQKIAGVFFDKVFVHHPDDVLEKVIEELGELSELRNLPICVVLTAKGAAELVEEAKEIGANSIVIESEKLMP